MPQFIKVRRQKKQAISASEWALCQLTVCVWSFREEVKEDFELQLIYSTVITSKWLLHSYVMSYRSEALLCYSLPKSR